MFAALVINRGLYGVTQPPIGNPEDAPSSRKGRNQRKRDAWR